MEALMQDSKIQEMLQQMQQESGNKQGHVPEGGQEVTPKPG